MSRSVLPNRREAETFEFDHSPDHGLRPIRYKATIGRDRAGGVAEVFLNTSKAGSGTDSAARDAAIAISIALQHGAPIDVLRGAMTRNTDGSPSSPLGALLDLLGTAA